MKALLGRVSFVVVLAGAVASGQDSRPVGRSLDDDLAAKLPRMRELMLDGLACTEPRAMDLPETIASALHTPFRGSYDRHSNIAAYWALLGWARRADDAEAKKALLRPFRVDALRNERAYVASMGSASDVRPYDDAWSLLLWREVERSAENDEVKALARELAAVAEMNLVGYLNECLPAASAESAAASRPKRRRRANTAAWSSGGYDSAAWAVVVMQLEPSRDGSIRESLASFCARGIGARRAASRKGFLDADVDFLWVPAVFALSDGLGSKDGASFAPYELPDYEPPPEKVTLENAHRLGREIVKLWPVAFRAGAGDAAARKLLNERLRTCLERKETWAGPFLTVSHWIPQFLYFTVWLADGRP